MSTTENCPINLRSFLDGRVVRRIDDGVVSTASFDEISEGWSGRGIVILSGGVMYLANAYMNLCYIRKNLKCELPVEVWYLGRRERNERIFSAISSLGRVKFIDAHEVQRRFPMKPNNLGRIHKGFAPASTEGWRTKSYCLLHSGFREVICLDSDCFLFQRPESLFHEFPEYASMRAVFSADIDTNPNTNRLVNPDTRIVSRLGVYANCEWDYTRPNPMWAHLGLEEDGLPEFESGFMMVDKTESADAVFASFYLNDESDFTYRYLYGDKDTFHLAWSFCNSPCHVIRDVSRKNEHIVGSTMGSVLFEHRVFINKFDIEKDWNESPNNNEFFMREKFIGYFNCAKQQSLPRIF